jgi:hypothetical protein
MMIRVALLALYLTCNAGACTRHLRSQLRSAAASAKCAECAEVLLLCARSHTWQTVHRVREVMAMHNLSFSASEP